MGKKRYTPEQIIGKLRDELFTGKIVSTLKEAQILIGRWRWEYNKVRPHRALGYRPRPSEAMQVMPRNPGYPLLRQDRWEKVDHSCSVVNPSSLNFFKSMIIQQCFSDAAYFTDEGSYTHHGLFTDFKFFPLS
jgi:hypothetical protein